MLPCRLLSIGPLTLDSLEPSLSITESGLLTPASEEFNQFLFESQKPKTEPRASSHIPANSIMIAVIGVGYVGYGLAHAFAKHYPIIAYDVSKSRINAVRQDFEARAVYLTSDPSEISQATHILIAVPTRVHEEDKSIDTSHLRSAIDTIDKYVRPGAVVVVESSVAVGMTRELLTPLQHSKGLKVGMSPERIDPGRDSIDFEAIPKVISGLDDESLAAVQQLYQSVFKQVVPVSSCEVAEMTKLYENCQRMIGIAYANEMADACQNIGIDPMEVCSAAATKPFGYQSYLPGAGVGGHCIPVNPYYLLSNMQFPLLQVATEKMWQRPAALATRVMNSLARRRTNSNMSSSLASSSLDSFSDPRLRLLIVGVAFKPGQSVIAHSPGVAMIEHLTDSYDNVEVDFCDPLVDAGAISCASKIDELSSWNVADLDRRYDAIIVVMSQYGLDLEILKRVTKAQVFNFTSSLQGFGPCKKQKVFGTKRDSAIEL